MDTGFPFTDPRPPRAQLLARGKKPEDFESETAKVKVETDPYAQFKKKARKVGKRKKKV